MKWNGTLNEATIKKSYGFATLSVLDESYYNVCCCKQEGNLPLV